MDKHLKQVSDLYMQISEERRFQKEETPARGKILSWSVPGRFEEWKAASVTGG